ncbi:MAG: SCO family protein [Burkholderiales bacterium]|nr:SCO family protein [Burkholderiales bacterium]
MLRTALASMGLAILAYGAAQWLTHDFQVWTAEGARRLAVELHPVPAPSAALVGPGLDGLPLNKVLADGQTITIVDLIYTNCQSVCAALGSGFQQLQSRLKDDGLVGKQGRVRLMSISFDAGRDTRAALQSYAERQHADARLWRFAAVPDPVELKHLLDRFQVLVIPDGMGGYEHNAALLVMDAQGRLVRIFDYSELDEALAFARSLLPAGSNR